MEGVSSAPVIASPGRHRKVTTLRIATVDDAASIEAVVRRSALAAYKDIFPPEAPMPTVEEEISRWRQQVLMPQEGSGSATRTIVAQNGEFVVGVVAASIKVADGRRVGHIAQLYVDPLMWGRGLGTSLYQAAVCHLVESGCVQLTLWTLEKNARARSWYERHCWKATGERVAVYAPAGIYDIVYALDPRQVPFT